MGNHNSTKHHHIHNRRNRWNTETPPLQQQPNYGPPPTSDQTNRMTVLPYAHVDSSLKALAGQAEGFGRHAVGGFHGDIFCVTSLSDDGPGSLRDACRKKEPLWIVFEVSGTIELASYLNVSSYKTIDGRGQRIKLTGKGLRLKECEHVIICNLEFAGGRGHDVDGIQIKPNSKHIWIDRCSLQDYDDGLIDITRQSTDITISRCHFFNHDKTMLIGADPSHHGDRCMRVTIHHCFFDGTRQRHPRVRFAKVHLYNNYTRNWGIYAVCASVESQIYSQCNIYEAGQKKVAFKYLTEKAGDKEEACSGCIISEGDLFMTGTQPGLLEPTAASSLFHPRQHYERWTVEPASKELKDIIQHCTGWQNVPRPPGIAVAPVVPYSNADSSLRALAGQAEGFGRHAVGGLHGELFHVTSLLDDGPGSLRASCRKKEPLWIVFEVSGTIELSSYLNVSSYKTIDGRGQRIKLTGKGLRLKECEHVIICNLEFEGGRGPDVDAIQIKPNSKHIWIDRCSLQDYDDGLIDITRESTNITISRCHFSNHDKTILIGGDPSNHGDRCMCITIHHCFFDGTKQRHPRVRFAKVHLYNNYTRNWGIYAVCASVESQIYSQCNIYEAGQKKVAFKYLTEKAGDRDEACSGCIISEGDLFMTGTQSGLLEPAAASSLFHPRQHYERWTVEPATKELKQIIQHCTGWQNVPRPPGQ